jgi:hypothetical protein
MVDPENLLRCGLELDEPPKHLGTPLPLMTGMKQES